MTTLDDIRALRAYAVAYTCPACGAANPLLCQFCEQCVTCCPDESCYVEPLPSELSDDDLYDILYMDLHAAEPEQWAAHRDSIILELARRITAAQIAAADDDSALS